MIDISIMIEIEVMIEIIDMIKIGDMIESICMKMRGKSAIADHKNEKSNKIIIDYRIIKIILSIAK